MGSRASSGSERQLILTINLWLAHDVASWAASAGKLDWRNKVTDGVRIPGVSTRVPASFHRLTDCWRRGLESLVACYRRDGDVGAFSILRLGLVEEVDVFGPKVFYALVPKVVAPNRTRHDNLGL